MYQNVKEAKINIEKERIQSMWKKRLKTSTSRSRRKLKINPIDSSSKTNILKFKCDLPRRGIAIDHSDKYTNVLKQYILSNKEIVDELRSSVS